MKQLLILSWLLIIAEIGLAQNRPKSFRVVGVIAELGLEGRKNLNYDYTIPVFAVANNLIEDHKNYFLESDFSCTYCKKKNNYNLGIILQNDRISMPKFLENEWYITARYKSKGLTYSFLRQSKVLYSNHQEINPYEGGESSLYDVDSIRLNIDRISYSSSEALANFEWLVKVKSDNQIRPYVGVGIGFGVTFRRNMVYGHSEFFSYDCLRPSSQPAVGMLDVYEHADHFLKSHNIDFNPDRILMFYPNLSLGVDLRLTDRDNFLKRIGLTFELNEGIQYFGFIGKKDNLIYRQSGLNFGINYML